MKGTRRNQFRLLTLGDGILIFTVIVVILVLYGTFYSEPRKKSNHGITIRQDGDTILQLDEKSVNRDGVIDFEFDGGHGQLEMKDGRIRMLPMDKSICPRQICSETGWIGSSSRIIACLPNRLIVSFQTDAQDDVDIVAN